MCERPKKWVILADKFNLTEEQLSKKYLLRLPVASKPYVCSIQDKVLTCNFLLKIIIMSPIVLVHFVMILLRLFSIFVLLRYFGMMFLQVLIKVFYFVFDSMGLLL